jgi:hypothetical protein
VPPPLGVIKRSLQPDNSPPQFDITARQWPALAPCLAVCHHSLLLSFCLHEFTVQPLLCCLAVSISGGVCVCLCVVHHDTGSTQHDMPVICARQRVGVKQHRQSVTYTYFLDTTMHVTTSLASEATGHRRCCCRISVSLTSMHVMPFVGVTLAPMSPWWRCMAAS